MSKLYHIHHQIVIEMHGDVQANSPEEADEAAKLAIAHMMKLARHKHEDDPDNFRLELPESLEIYGASALSAPPTISDDGPPVPQRLLN